MTILRLVLVISTRGDAFGKAQIFHFLVMNQPIEKSTKLWTTQVTNDCLTLNYNAWNWWSNRIDFNNFYPLLNPVSLRNESIIKHTF